MAEGWVSCFFTLLLGVGRLAGGNTERQIGRTPAGGAGEQWNKADGTPPALEYHAQGDDRHTRY